MAVIERERVTERPAPEVPARTRRFEVAMWVLVIIAVAAVVATAIMLTTAGEEATTEAVPDFRSDQQKLAELANQGYIPAAAVDWELLRTERLVNQGQIPAQTLESYGSPIEPLFSADERLMIELAQTGQIPMEAVDWGDVQLKKLVNQGLIPREALTH